MALVENGLMYRGRVSNSDWLLEVNQLVAIEGQGVVKSEIRHGIEDLTSQLVYKTLVSNNASSRA